MDDVQRVQVVQASEQLRQQFAHVLFGVLRQIEHVFQQINSLPRARSRQHYAVDRGVRRGGVWGVQTFPH